ncbi:hypothetical protein E2C01_029778 [Portunus trituberculatus]|uniref:Uncharacterized protein n=1 Tax=Portunus trituberculatus TaxID=210409 RepID=A0A5B7ETU0_PORTR|nr:hypothetical protein [Portunus trituberculatus]
MNTVLLLFSDSEAGEGWGLGRQVSGSSRLRANTGGGGEDLTRNLWVAFEDGTSEGCVRMRVLPVTVQIEGANCIVFWIGFFRVSLKKDLDGLVYTHSEYVCLVLSH